MKNLKQYLLSLSLLAVISCSVVEMAHARYRYYDRGYDYGDGEYGDGYYDDYDSDYGYYDDGGRTARGVVGGALTGAAIGGLAGGGRGAAWGAGVGGLFGGLSARR